MMDEQIRIAKNGGKGYIAAKINSLCDMVIMDKLVEASQAGVKVDLVVRGICCLIAGVEGYTENITVRSIVGRFLEHSRIFIFGRDGKEQKIYIGSADYMPRNTIRRVEVATPVEDERLKKTSETRKTYEGLPVTSVALILPLLYSFHRDIGEHFPAVYGGALFLIALAFITRFKVKKPSMKTMLIFVGVGALELVWMLYKTKTR